MIGSMCVCVCVHGHTAPPTDIQRGHHLGIGNHRQQTSLIGVNHVP